MKNCSKSWDPGIQIRLILNKQTVSGEEKLDTYTTGFDMCRMRAQVWGDRILLSSSNVRFPRLSDQKPAGIFLTNMKLYFFSRLFWISQVHDFSPTVLKTNALTSSFCVEFYILFVIHINTVKFSVNLVAFGLSTTV